MTVPSSFAVAALGSCRVYNPLRAALEAKRIAGFINLFPHVHNPAEIRQAIRLLDGKAPPAEMAKWISFSAKKAARSKGLDVAIQDSDVVVVELSSVRLITFEGWELQINTFRQNLLAENVPDPLIKGLNRDGAREEARKAILELPLEEATRAVVAGAVFREAEAAELTEHVAALYERIPLPVLFVGTVESNVWDEPIPQRIKLNGVMRDFVAGRPGCGFFDPTPMVQAVGHDAAMGDMSHYLAEYEPAVGEALVEALSALGPRAPA